MCYVEVAVFIDLRPSPSLPTAMAAARAQHRAAQRERRGSDALRAIRGSGDAVESGCPPESGGPPESGDAPRVNVSVTVVFEGSPPIAQ